MKWLLLLPACLVISACANFYPIPGNGEKAALIIEKSDRREIGWYESYDVSRIDDLSVSHIGTNLGEARIRVAPGIHKILFTVRYRHGGFANPIMQAVFPLLMEVADGQVLETSGSINEANANVTFWLIDRTTNKPVFPAMTTGAFPVTPNMYTPVGGSVAWIPVKNGSEGQVTNYQPVNDGSKAN